MKEGRNNSFDSQKEADRKEVEAKQASEAASPSACEAVTLSKQEYDALLQKLKGFQTLEERMLRSAADFENAKKRLAKDREEFSRVIVEAFLYELLPVLDNFERALSHRTDLKTPAEKSVWSGIELIYKQLAEMLKLRGLSRMDVMKKPFDPHLHDATAQIQSDTETEGAVAEEVVPGYLFYGKVLRPAKVKVYTKQKLADVEKIEEIT